MNSMDKLNSMKNQYSLLNIHQNMWLEPISAIHQPNNDERVVAIIDEWKNECLKLGIKFHAISTLSCETLENGNVLTFATHKKISKSNSKTIHCKINKIATTADQEDKTSVFKLVRIKINGKNLETGNDFEMIIEDVRSPIEINGIGYSETNRITNSSSLGEASMKDKSIRSQKDEEIIKTGEISTKEITVLPKKDESANFGGMKKGFLL